MQVKNQEKVGTNSWPSWQINISGSQKLQVQINCWWQKQLVFLWGEAEAKKEATHEDYLDDATDLYRWAIRDPITAIVGEEIRNGLIGAIFAIDPDVEGCYLVKLTGTPYTSEDTAALVCEGIYLTKVGGGPKWLLTSCRDRKRLVFAY